MSELNKTIKPFDGSKYNVWKARVRALIEETILEEDALSIIDDPDRPDDINEGEWFKLNKVAKGIIIRNLSDSVVGCATNNPKLTAREIFQNLDELYMRQSVATALAAEIKLINFKYNNNQSLTEHFILFDDMICEMEAATGDKLKETSKIARLLATLPKTYDSLIVAIQTLTDENLIAFSIGKTGFALVLHWFCTGFCAN